MVDCSSINSYNGWIRENVLVLVNQEVWYKINRQSLERIAIAGGLTALSTILFAFNPAVSVFYPPCPFHFLTGFYCPGCGTLRALHQLLHGNLLAAMKLNVLTVILVPFIGYGFVFYITAGIKSRSLPKIFIPAALIWILFGVIILFGILRNIPAEPFSFLAPHY
jgi:hypothetical protein